MNAISASGEKPAEPLPNNIDEIIVALDRALRAHRRVIAARQALEEAEQALASAYNHYEILSAGSRP